MGSRKLGKGPGGTGSHDDELGMGQRKSGDRRMGPGTIQYKYNSIKPETCYQKFNLISNFQTIKTCLPKVPY